MLPTIFIQTICLCPKALITCTPSSFWFHSSSWSSLSGHAETNMKHPTVHKYMQSHERVRSMLIPATLSAGVHLIILHRGRGVNPSHVWLMTSNLASGDLVGGSEMNIQLFDRSHVFRGQSSRQATQELPAVSCGKRLVILKSKTIGRSVSILHVKVQNQAPVAANVCPADNSKTKTPTSPPVCCPVAELSVPVDEGRRKIKESMEFHKNNCSCQQCLFAFE